MEIEKIAIGLRLLANRVIDYENVASQGIQATLPKVLDLWREYNEYQLYLSENYPSMFDHFAKLKTPIPYFSAFDSAIEVGTSIYKPEHFKSLRMDVENMIETVKLLSKAYDVIRSEKKSWKNIA